jgi:prepilin-type N-terminal cleavage/methylation domain-containing protein/prepilin-type processing-associated H-X9-DG protein
MTKNATSAAAGRRGFTLVELLVVIAIIGVLIALLVGGVAKAYQLAKNMQCQHNLSQIAKAVIAYTTTTRGSIPPTKIIKADGRILNWCNLLATQGIDAQNMASADQKQGTDNKQRTGQDSILLCPNSSLLYCDPAATWTDPSDPLAQGWCRLPLQQSATVMVDTSYYWNGYVGTSTTLLGRFPSEVLDENETDPTKRAAQVHDLAEIKNRSRMVMVADGVYFQGDIGGGGGGGGGQGGLNPERIAARHPGGHKGGGVTNLGFYDGHVESMDRFPDPDWANEAVEGFNNDTKESTSPSVSPLVPIMNKKLRPDPGLDLAPADIRNGLGPMFLLPRR